jgi:hypothetical protein
VIEEFKKIQRQNLEDIKRMKEGKQPMTDDELKKKLQDDREKQIEDTKRKFEEVQRQKEESVKNIIETALKTKKTGED